MKKITCNASSSFLKQAAKLIVLLFFSLISNITFAQTGNKKISGKIVNQASEPLVGAIVRIKGNTKGVITNQQGQFSIQTLNDKSALQISMIGYKDIEVSLNGKNDLTITMLESSSNLSEVVVVGYGTQKKETLTGSVTNIKSKDINTTKSTSVVSNIQGKIPGVLIRQQTAEPGTFNSMVSIRGFGSPLLVIDGVARDGMSDLERLNPEDIESISVLKDAAAAIYGMNADNGVLIVTTKKGTKGQAKFSFNSFYGTKQPTSMLKNIDAYSYRLIKNEMQLNTGLAPTFSDIELAKWKDGVLPGYKDYNWFSNTLRDFTGQQTHNISASGGNDLVTFYSSLGLMEDNGILKSDIQKYKKYTFRNNVTFKLSNNLKATVSVAGKVDNNTSPQGSYFWFFKPLIIADRGYTPFTPADPTHISRVPPEWTNPYALANESVSGYDKWSNVQYQTSVNVTYDVPYLKGLQLGILGVYDGNVYNYSNLQRMYYQYDFVTDVPTVNKSNLYKNSVSQFARKDLQLQANYKNTFNTYHHVGATIVYELRGLRNDYIQAQRQYDDVYTHDIIDQGSLTNLNNAGNRSIQNYLSLLGRFNYDYKSKYLLELAFRNDGSYRYSPNNRWAMFPSASAGWRISEEPFIKRNIPSITNLKIRASYGLMGSDAGNAFEYYSGYKFGAIDGGYVLNSGVLTMGMVPPGVINENLTWVKTKTANIGVDLELWDGKLGITTDVFQKNRDGLLATRIQSVPNTFGASFPQENINTDLVRGIELIVSHKGKLGAVNYNLSANATYSRKYLIYNERAPYASTMQIWKDAWGNNRYLGREWGYIYSGQYTNITQYQTAPLLGGANGNSKNLPGSYKITDVNGDGIIDGNDQLPVFWSGQYQGYAGNPPLQFGMTINADWKGFDINVLLQGAALFSIYNAPNDVWGYGTYPNLWEKYLDRWHTEIPGANPYDPATKWLPGQFPALRSNFVGTTDGLITDRWRLDAKYLRIKSVELGYTLPKNLLKKSKFDSIRIYVNGFNLYTFANELAKGLDPEREEGSYTADLTYPLMRSFNLGINLNF